MSTGTGQVTSLGDALEALVAVAAGAGVAADVRAGRGRHPRGGGGRVGPRCTRRLGRSPWAAAAQDFFDAASAVVGGARPRPRP